jgi:general secretion pathway protein I
MRDRASQPEAGFAPPRRPQAGFTLIEVLVAFLIAGLALAVLAHAGIEGLRASSLSARYQEALARAQSHLAAAVDASQPGDRQGDEGDGFHWHVRTVPLAHITTPSGPATLLDVSVAISWGPPPGRSVQLDTEQLAGGDLGAAP